MRAGQLLMPRWGRWAAGRSPVAGNQVNVRSDRRDGGRHCSPESRRHVHPACDTVNYRKCVFGSWSVVPGSRLPKPFSERSEQLGASFVVIVALLSSVGGQEVDLCVLLFIMSPFQPHRFRPPLEAELNPTEMSPSTCPRNVNNTISLKFCCSGAGLRPANVARVVPFPAPTAAGVSSPNFPGEENENQRTHIPSLREGGAGQWG